MGMNAKITAPGSRRNDACGVSSADDLVARKKLTDFLDSGVGGIRTVHRILADRLRVHLADRAGRRLRGIGRPHQITIPDDGVFAFQHLDYHWTRYHEVDEFAKE